MWVQHYLACDGVRLEGLTVVSRCNANNDGIDIDGCQRVRIANCDIRSGDDAIVLKSTLNRPCKHVAVANCVLSSDCNAFKLGLNPPAASRTSFLTIAPIYDTRLAGIALEMVDGGTLDQVNISNVAMDNVRCPYFIRLGTGHGPSRRARRRPGMGRAPQREPVRHPGERPPTHRAASPVCRGARSENLTLSNIRIRFAGGGTEAEGWAGH